MQGYKHIGFKIQECKIHSFKIKKPKDRLYKNGKTFVMNELTAPCAL